MNAHTIRQFPLFANLPEAEFNILSESLKECHFQADEIVLEEGSLSEYFYLLLEGEVEIIKSLGTADERVVAVSGKGSIIGEMSMFSKDGAHTAGVRARTPLTLLRITFDQFDAVLHRYPPLAYDLLRLYSSRLENSESLTIRDLREKNRQLTLAYHELRAAQAAMIEKEKLEHELELAAKIQQGILPEKLPVYPGLDFGSLMIPARHVGGDFYDLIPLDDHRIGLVVGDVCDKGMPAALFMALSYSAARAEALRHNRPGDTVRAINRQLLQINRSGMFVTLLFGILDRRTCQFDYARAGHPSPLVLDGQNQPVEIHYRLGQPVGLLEDIVIDEQSIQVPPGGTMLVYSDGLSETVEANKDGPSLSHLCSTTLDRGHVTAQGLCDELWRVVSELSPDASIPDDFTLIVLRNLMPAGAWLTPSSI